MAVGLYVSARLQDSIFAIAAFAALCVAHSDFVRVAANGFLVAVLIEIGVVYAAT